ncbi:TI13A translocase, partial [Alaudala cheleensis]|nr:TI13A translocase [Alaudala cheleensis]
VTLGMESGFGSDFSSGGSGGGKLDPGLIMEQVKVQIAVANAQELLQRMTDKCFRKCIGKPGGALDNSEQVRTGGRSGDPRASSSGLPLRLSVPQKCIAMCMDRYMDSWNTVSRAYSSRLQRERANM